MILSDVTLGILKNFNYINENLLFKPGNLIQTMNSSGTVLAQAVVPEEFPVEFGIYELGKFLGALSLFTEKELIFTRDNFVTLGKGRSKIKYTFAEPSMLNVAPYQTPQFPEDFIEVDITSEQLATALKACQVLQLPEISFMGDGAKLWVLGEKNADPSSDKYELEVGVTDKEFKSILTVDNLKLLPLDYKIKVTTKGIINFHAGNVDYWIAASQVD